MKYFTVFILISISSPTSAQPLDMSLFHGMQPRNIGPAGMSGRVTSIAVVENDMDIIYVGAAAGGIWKSENSGHTWTTIFENERTASIGDIAIYQNNPSIIYVGTGEGNPRNSQNSGWGMYKSMDAGRTWQHLGLENTRQMHRVIVHPDNPDIVWAGASGATWGDSEDRGIYKTTDGGKTWRKVLYVNNRTGIADLRMDPSNPNKLIAAMWEHRRWPWFFKSGGEGSGIYMSVDGGETWNKISEGLPETELGRVGLAFAPSKSDIVYAYVESKVNAVFRSTDGGYTWEKRSKPRDGNIGSRPFYYADIYVDVKNENRVYSISGSITVTEDGGKTWSVFAPGNRIHTDHHAWWAHPTDPDFLIEGNDGGLFTTHDRGKSWLFTENLPLAQFYHVQVDNEVPYNIYGGLQDNGSWIGPSQTWFKGGIRNMYWQRLSVGDGFDVVPDPLDVNYGYAMGQAGNLVRYHRPSGQLQRIKPIHPDGDNLRFNWNAGIAVNPHDKKTIYYGSQYLHKTSDHGQSWQTISPDLTTNDPEKQKFLESGGLSYDVTGAEFHTAIISIAPSPVENGTIWVGSDDGNVQVTRNGGDSWKNVIGNLRGVPNTTWVPHIEASHYNADEAFVVFEDHRRNNWEPYVYHTTDGGNNWSRIVDGNDVQSFVYCLAQDPVEENLLFCGTDEGLYVSFDKGGQWHRWSEGYPTVPTQDLVVHPRDGDLVIGTFGRAFWVLDDIRPLREIAANMSLINSELHAFSAPDAILAIIGESHGYRHGKVGEVLYNGENREYGALLSLWMADVDDDGDTLKVEITDVAGNVVRHLDITVKKSGLQRMVWRLRRDAARSPNTAKPDDPIYRAGMPVAPGEYTVNFACNGNKASTKVKVLPDPRLNRTAAEIRDKDEMISQFYDLMSGMTTIADEIRDIESTTEIIGKLAEKNEIKISDELSAFKKALKAKKEKMLGKQVQGIYQQPETILSKLGRTGFLLDHVLQPVSENQQNQFNLTKQACAQFAKGWNLFKSTELSNLKKLVGDKGVGLFKTNS